MKQNAPHGELCLFRHLPKKHYYLIAYIMYRLRMEIVFGNVREEKS